MFGPDFFTANRKALLARSGVKLIVIPANAQLQRNADTAFPFRQDSSFWYLCGVGEPDYTVVVSERGTYLIAPKLTSYQRIMETQVAASSLQQASGIGRILQHQEGWQTLARDLKRYQRVGVLTPANTRYYGFAPNPARARLRAHLRRLYPQITLIDLKKDLAQLRMVKQPPEIQAIRRAIQVTSDTIQEVFTGEWFNKFRYEYEIEAALGFGFRRRGATGHAFTPIVISGAKTASIHNYASEDALPAGRLLQIDVGAEVSNYAADISRVVPVGYAFTTRQKEIVAAVQDVQAYAMKLVKPGTLIRENEKQIEQYMGRTLKILGLISRETKTAIRARYPHSCSHMLGLDVHDAADYSQLLAENMVLTVEPGIYIPEEGIGVRIEDDVLVTKTGHEILSRDLPAVLN